MSEHPIENLMKSTMENIHNMVDVNTIIGDPIETKDGSYIIPISKVSFGFASGGSEFSNRSFDKEEPQKYPFGGGSGAGVTVKPVAFLVVRADSVRLLPVEADTTYDRIVDTVPQVIDMIKETINKFTAKKNKEEEPKSTNPDIDYDLDSFDNSYHLNRNDINND